MQQLSSPPALQDEVPANQNFETLSWAAVYGKRHPATTGLTWGYYGGRWGGFSIADGTLTLTNSATNYAVVEKATGAISVATANTNWNDDEDYARVYKLTTAGGVVSAVEDHRAGPLGIYAGEGGSGSSAGDASTNTSASVDSEIALFSGTAGKTLKRATGTGYAKVASGVLSAVSTATAAADLQGTGLVAGSVGFREIPQNSQSGAYTCVAADSGKHILHPSADTTTRTFTIPANSSVAYPVGTAITFVNQNSAGVLSIAITTDTMRLAGAGTTGTRTLAANGIATALKVTSTEWLISGNGLT